MVRAEWNQKTWIDPWSIALTMPRSGEASGCVRDPMVGLDFTSIPTLKAGLLTAFLGAAFTASLMRLAEGRFEARFAGALRAGLGAGFVAFVGRARKEGSFARFLAKE